MEMATPESEDLVSRVYTQALQDRHDGRALDDADLMVYHIEMLSQEVNSGASFEQYFRWASVEEIAQAVGRLSRLRGIAATPADHSFPEIPSSPSSLRARELRLDKESRRS